MTFSEIKGDKISLQCFPADNLVAAQEANDPLDAVAENQDDGDRLPEFLDPIRADQLHETLDQLSSNTTVQVPEHEQTRKREWLKLPRKIRATIRRLHLSLGHCSQDVLLRMLRGARSHPGYLKAAKLYS